ncbi:MAG: phosphohydrolase [Clostridia bacterium]|nr:phosphohydrolase [Clostridia bacterium]MDD4375895.1 phosphohydrolase [Clostridia bacterium]
MPVMNYAKLHEIRLGIKPIGKSKVAAERDTAFFIAIEDLIEHPAVLSSNLIMHHGWTSCYKHMYNVAYYSYKMCKFLKLDWRAAARGAMLHDLYLYNWHKEIGYFRELIKGHHWKHPKIALENANRHFDLTEKEKDIILNHMWPITVKVPKYKETYIVSFADDICCFMELFQSIYMKLKRKFKRKSTKKEEV